RAIVFEQMRKGRLGSDQGRFRVECEHAVPSRQVALRHRLPNKTAGDIEKRIDATGLGADRLHRGGSGGAGAKIDGDRERWIRETLLRGADVKHRNASAAALRFFGCGAAKNAERTRDDYGFSAHDLPPAKEI